ncbi:MAG: cyanase [SAR324 cluster bacterium]
MNRLELTDKIAATRLKKGLTWKKICETIGGGSPLFITAALLGQMKLTAKQAKAAAELLELGEEGQLLLQQTPYKGSLPPGPPTDPLIYRFHEITQVFGTTLKELIEEEFGDGIMSAIDFEMDLERMPDPKGDRVKITLHGKFLPYRRF